KQNYNWDYEPFYVPEVVYEDFREKIGKKGEQAEKAWEELFNKYKEAYPEEAKSFKRAINGELPENWVEALPTYEPGTSFATRDSSGQELNAIAKALPDNSGGSADLASSNKTMINGAADLSKENFAGRNIWFGVREFAMAAALNGMALHGGLKVYGGTFFVFSDYLRPAVRLSALMKTPVIYVWTHDSIAVGEDGPTHE